MALGFPHPDHLLRTLDSRQIADWIAYDQINPIDVQSRDDWRAGLIASTVANYSGKLKRPVKIADFMPKFRQARKKMSDLLDTVKLLGKTYGGLKSGKPR